MVKNAGIASVYSFQFISVIGEHIITPTIANTGPVASDGTARKIGEKNKASTKQIAIVNEVRPVRPPSATPAALSM